MSRWSGLWVYRVREKKLDMYVHMSASSRQMESLVVSGGKNLVSYVYISSNT